MPRFHISQDLKGFVLYILGIITPILISQLISQAINLSEATLIGAIVILIIGTLYFFTQVNKNIVLLSESMQATIRYIDEKYPGDPKRFHGLIFNELKRLVSEAEREILVLSVVNKEWGAQVTDTHNSRQSYLRVLKRHIEDRHESGFTYKRLIQVPGDLQGSLVPYIGEATAGHCNAMLALARDEKLRAGPSKLNISIKKVTTQRLTGFMIFDNRCITVAIDGLTEDGHSYQAGLFVVEDKQGHLVNHFRLLFNNLENSAELITTEELMSAETPIVEKS